MVTVSQYLEDNHTRIIKINKILEEFAEVISTAAKTIYNFVINKENVSIDEDVDTLILIDDLDFLIKKLNDYDYDIYLLSKIIKQLIIVDDKSPELNLKELEEDFYFYDNKIKELSNGWYEFRKCIF